MLNYIYLLNWFSKEIKYPNNIHIYLIRFADQVSVGEEVLVPGHTGLAPTKVFNISGEYIWRN